MAGLSLGERYNPGRGNGSTQRDCTGLDGKVRFQRNGGNLTVIADHIQLRLDGLALLIPILLLRGGLQQDWPVTGKVTVRGVDRPCTELLRRCCESKGSRYKQETQGCC